MRAAQIEINGDQPQVHQLHEFFREEHTFPEKMVSSLGSAGTTAVRQDRDCSHLTAEGTE